MLEVSENFLSSVESNARQFRPRITFDDVVISEGFKKVEIKEVFNDDDKNLKMGCSCSNQLEMEIFAPLGVTVNWGSAVIKVEMGLVLHDESLEYVTMGYFYPSSATSDDDYRIVKITAYDYMSRLEDIYVPNLSLPTTDTAIVADICSQAGVEFVGTTTDCPITKIFSATCRQTLGYMAGLRGLNAKITRDNKLDFTWYVTQMRWEGLPEYTWDDLSSKSWYQLETTREEVG